MSPLTSHRDDYLDCLAYMTKYYGRSRSRDAIKAGLAYDERGMSPESYQEAAEKLGLNTRRVEKKLFDIDAALLPATIILNAKGAVVLLSLDKGRAEIYNPKEDKTQTIKQASLEKSYTGEAILTYPAPEFHDPKAERKRPHESHWFWGPFWKNSGIYTNVIIAAILINLFGLTSPIFIMNVYDRVIPNNAIETGWVLGLAALTIFIFDFIIRMLRGYFIDFAGKRIDIIASGRIYDQALDMKLSERPKSSGAFANMLKDFESVKDFMTSATVTGLVDVPFTFLFVFVIYLIAGPIALMLLGLILLIVVAGFLLQFPLKHFVRKSLHSAETKHGMLVETIHGLETIKAIGADGRFRARYGQATAENAMWGQKSRFYSALGGNIATWVQQSATILIVLMGMYLVRDQDLTMGGLIACVILSGRAMTPVGQVANLMARYHQAASAMKTIDHLMQKPVDRPSTTQFLHRPKLEGKCAFDKVSFVYPATNHKVLNQVSFTIQQGERVGLIGRIGSGKSTIARLIVDLYDPTEGTILMDDTDERQIDPADLRRNIGYIAQDVVLFSGTVRDNIVAGYPQASEEEILEVAKKSGVHEFISKHPSGYDAMIGERGEGLSGGQRQAIALARAMLRRPAIYVCDEPTNAMDVQAEEAFRRHMAEEAKDKTLILITHRQPLLAMVDRLILIDQGQVVADGPREEVLNALSGGKIEVEET